MLSSLINDIKESLRKNEIKSDFKSELGLLILLISIFKKNLKNLI
jgi:hypothetical protein